MPIATKPYSFSNDAQTYADPDMNLRLSKKNDLRRFLLYPQSDSEPKVAHFIAIVGIITGDGKPLAGGAVLAVTAERILGLITEGRGTAGALAETAGKVEAFSLPVASIDKITVERGWRGKVKSVEFKGSASDPFQFVISEIVGAIVKSKEGRPATFATFATLLKDVAGKVIEI